MAHETIFTETKLTIDGEKINARLTWNAEERQWLIEVLANGMALVEYTDTAAKLYAASLSADDMVNEYIQRVFKERQNNEPVTVDMGRFVRTARTKNGGCRLSLRRFPKLSKHPAVLSHRRSTQGLYTEMTKTYLYHTPVKTTEAGERVQGRVRKSAFIGQYVVELTSNGIGKTDWYSYQLNQLNAEELAEQFVTDYILLKNEADELAAKQASIIAIRLKRDTAEILADFLAGRYEGQISTVAACWQQVHVALNAALGKEGGE